MEGGAGVFLTKMNEGMYGWYLRRDGEEKTEKHFPVGGLGSALAIFRELSVLEGVFGPSIETSNSRSPPPSSTSSSALSHPSASPTFASFDFFLNCTVREDKKEGNEPLKGNLLPLDCTETMDRAQQGSLKIRNEQK